MKDYHVSAEEYDCICKKISESDSRIILHKGLIIEDIGDGEEYELACTYQRDAKAEYYEWMNIPNPHDYE